MSDFDWYDEHLFNVDSMIERHGFATQYVIGERDKPSWGYSIGFLAHGHPEVLVIGLDDVSTHGVLRLLFREIVAGVTRPVGREYDQTLKTDQLRLLPIPEVHWRGDSDLLASAVEYYRGVGMTPDGFRAIQLVWATPSGHFPWDPECSTRWRRMQPILEQGGRKAA